jgi:hypothetical protein
MLDPENEVDVKNGSTILGSFSNLPGPSYFNIHAGGADAITKFVLSDAPLEDCCFEADNCSAIPINTVRYEGSGGTDRAVPMARCVPLRLNPKKGRAGKFPGGITGLVLSFSFCRAPHIDFKRPLAERCRIKPEVNAAPEAYPAHDAEPRWRL